MSIKRPWYKRYPAEFMNGTALLTFDQKGAYSILLDILYDHGGEIDLTDAQIARLLGCHWHRWTRIKRELVEAGKLEITPHGKLTNRRASEELIPTYPPVYPPPYPGNTPLNYVEVNPEVKSKFSNDFSRARAIANQNKNKKKIKPPRRVLSSSRATRSLTPDGASALHAKPTRKTVEQMAAEAAVERAAMTPEQRAAADAQIAATSAYFDELFGKAKPNGKDHH